MTTGLPARRPGRRRRRLSLNGLAIQVSGFALSFILVALLVVGSSRAALVQENETVTGRVPVGAPATPVPLSPPQPTPSMPTAPRPVEGPAPPAAPVPPAPVEGVLPVEPPPVAELGLTDDAAGTAMFVDEQGLAPGVSEQRCIRVSLQGNASPDLVSLYAADVQGALAPYLDLVVEVGPDEAVFGDCSGFRAEDVLFTGTLADFGSGHTDFDSGLPTWVPTAPGEARSFRFTVTVRDVPEAEGLSSGFGFIWEARA